MNDFLLFYYLFSVLFMLGYVDWTEVSEKFWQVMVGIFLLILFAPLMLPVNIGYFIKKNS